MIKKMSFAVCALLVSLQCSLCLFACGDQRETTDEGAVALASASQEKEASRDTTNESAEGIEWQDASEVRADAVEEVGVVLSDDESAWRFDASSSPSASAASASASGYGSGEPARITPDPSSANAPSVSEKAEVAVSITVDGSMGGRGIFVSTTVSLWEGATVYDALCACGVAFSGNSGYIRSINGLAEFDAGPGSGWLYSVNGVTPSVSCGSYALSNGDSVYWRYVTEY